MGSVCQKLVVFSGAGMSAESGISTFRSAGGLWEQYRIEDVATPDAWQKNPELVQDFYNQRRKNIIDVEPNVAHKLIFDLENNFEVTIITQNIDDLHERAGSTKVIHLHGNIRYAKSSGPNQEKDYYLIDGWELKLSDCCPEGFPLRPHVVWFGEEVPMYEVASKIISDCNILLVIGTSLQVYPAAGLIHFVPKDSLKFIIDPLADELVLPSGFVSIKKNASEGMREFKALLTQMN